MAKEVVVPNVPDAIEFKKIVKETRLEDQEKEQEKKNVFLF